MPLAFPHVLMCDSAEIRRIKDSADKQQHKPFFFFYSLSNTQKACLLDGFVVLLHHHNTALNSIWQTIGVYNLLIGLDDSQILLGTVSEPPRSVEGRGNKQVIHTKLSRLLSGY